LREISTRTLTIYYSTALTIVALLSLVCHFILAGELRVSQGSAAMINVSGRQRMLSQRMAGMAAEYRLGIPGAREELLASTAEFEDGHRRLLASLDSNGVSSSEAKSLYTSYWGGESSLDARCRDFIATARRLAAMPASDPASAPLLNKMAEEARRPLLAGLDEVVSIRQRQAEERMWMLDRIQWGILIVILATLFLEALAIFRPMVHRIVGYNSELLRLATTDALTGASNRRSFLASGNAETERTIRSGAPLSVMLLDIDRFKSINDTYGHAAGDQVLVAVARVLARELRSADVLGRIGGEEFAILLPDTSIETAAQVGERLREAVAATEVFYEGAPLSVTVSIGAIQVAAQSGGFVAAMSAADIAMYRAKQGGRNRVIVDRTTSPAEVPAPLLSSSLVNPPLVNPRADASGPLGASS
jgi:diguanylate cyclase (GGDEF)-like protein